MAHGPLCNCDMSHVYVEQVFHMESNSSHSGKSYENLLKFQVWNFKNFENFQTIKIFEKIERGAI